MTAPMPFRGAYEAELTRRETDRRAREEADRAQQEADHARTLQLHAALAAETAFLNEKHLTLDHTRYAVTLDHPNFRLRAYFEAGQISVTSADKRNTATPTAAPRMQEIVETVDAALGLLARYLADEFH